MALGGEDQNISFWCEKARALQWEKRKEEEEKRRREKEEEIQVWNISFVWKFEIHVWNFPIC